MSSQVRSGKVLPLFWMFKFSHFRVLGHDFIFKIQLFVLLFVLDICQVYKASTRKKVALGLQQSTP